MQNLLQSDLGLSSHVAKYRFSTATISNVLLHQLNNKILRKVIIVPSAKELYCPRALVQDRSNYIQKLEIDLGISYWFACRSIHGGGIDEFLNTPSRFQVSQLSSVGTRPWPSLPLIP